METRTNEGEGELRFTVRNSMRGTLADTPCMERGFLGVDKGEREGASKGSSWEENKVGRQVQRQREREQKREGGRGG